MSFPSFYVTFELNNKSKKVDKSVLIKDIKRSLLFSNKKFVKKKQSNFKTVNNLQAAVEKLDFFLPFRELQKGGYYYKDKEFYIPGYGFMEYDSNLDYFELEDTNHINSLIKNFSDNELELVTRDVINQERDKMKSFFKCQFRAGQLVEIVDGDYANMLGRVVDYQEKDKIYKVIVHSRSNEWYLRLTSHQLGIRDGDLISSDEI